MIAGLKNMEQKKRQHLFFVAIFILLQILFIWRSFYGFNTSDEMYYIGTSERIFRGEKILIDEWNPTQQMCAFLLHPIYCLIRWMLGSTEGIVMASRFVYLIYAALISLFLYLRFQKRGYTAFAPAFLFLLFAPFGLFAMSYNTIELGILTVLLGILSVRTEHSVPEYILCGMLAAMVVLANPFAVVMYGGYGLLCLVMTLYGRKKAKKVEEILQLKTFLWMTLGAGIMLILFLIFVFQRGSLGEVLENLPHIIGDAEHQTGYWWKFKRYFYLCFKNYRYMFWGLGVIYLITWFDKKCCEHGWLYMLLASVVTAPYLFYYGFISRHIAINYQMLPLTFWSLEAYFVTKKKDKRLFYSWFLPAMLFTMVVQMATNTGIVAVSAAYGNCTIVGMVFVAMWLKEAWNGEKTPRLLVGLFAGVILILQFTGIFYQRMAFALGESPVSELTQQIERGPLKGVYTTPNGVTEYEQILNDLDRLELTEEDRLMVVGVAPWIYLYAEAGCGNYSTWQVHENSTQLYAYYALHPDKFPNVIYMAHWADVFMESELSKQFVEKDYQVIDDGARLVLVSPERAAR